VTSAELPAATLIVIDTARKVNEMRKSQSALIGLMVAGLLLNSGRDRVTSAGYSPRSRLRQASVRLYAASGATIEFWAQNGATVDGIPAAIQRIPHLVLHRNGKLTGSGERTLHVSLGPISVPPGNSTIALDVETQRTDPDMVGGSSHRIQVWHEERDITNTSGMTQTLTGIEFVVEFPPILPIEKEIITTPTDYFSGRITLSDSEAVSETLYAQDYAFLMENQVTVPLPPLQESTRGSAPQRLTLYYSDMIPFQNGFGEGRTRLTRSEVSGYVQRQLAPRMVEAIRMQTNDWGFPWHATWASFRREDGRQLGVALSDRTTWYHSRAPHDGHAGISLNVEGEFARTYYASLTERLMSLFQHELFHSLQRNLVLHYGNEDVAGLDDAWLIFTEGTATLASSVGEPDAEFDTASGPGHYMLSTNWFIGPHHSLSELNASYRHMSPYAAALYWRFLFEQCEGMGVIRESLGVLYSGDSVDTQSSTDVIGGLPAVMDQVLANASCPFSTHTESLNAFARAIYALRVQGGRCTGSETSECAGLIDPNDLYLSPPVANITYTGGELRYDTALQPAPAGIPSSFGMDFIEITLPQTADGSSLTIEIAGEADAAAEFSAQVWELALDRQTAIPVRSPVTLSTTPDGHLVHRISLLDWRTTQRLAIIIVRTDAQEQADPIGAYTLSLRSDT